MSEQRDDLRILLGRVAHLAARASVVLLAASTAQAAGFASAEFAGESGTVVSTNPTGLYFNPASIAFVHGLNIFAGGVLALRGGTWTHARSSGEVPDPPDAEGANVGTAHFVNLFGAPALAATYNIGNLVLGAATYVPFGGRIGWSRNSIFANDANYPAASSGVQRWTMIEGGVTHLYSTVGAAFRHDWFAVGLTANLIYSSITNLQAKSYSAAGLPDSTSEGRNRLDVSGFDGSFGVGVMIDAIPDQLWFGASYQSRPNLTGEMKLNGTLTLAYQGETSSRPVTFTHALPDILRLGVGYRVSEALELRLFGDYTRWSVLQGQCVSMRDKPCAVSVSGSDATPESTTIQYMARNWNDTFALRFGLTYELSPGVELLSGVGFESSAVPNSTLDPGLPDAANVRMSLGGRIAISETVTGTLGITGVWYVSRDNTGQSTLSTPDLPARRADGGGVYELWMALLNLGVEIGR